MSVQLYYSIYQQNMANSHPYLHSMWMEDKCQVDKELEMLICSHRNDRLDKDSVLEK